MRTILLVDDNESLIELFSLFFQEEGWNVLTAPGGKECLKILEHESPDMILMDIMMEPMDGWETLHHVKENPRWAKIPVAMLTGKALSPKEFESNGMLFENYLLKPLSESKMILLSGQVVDAHTNVQRDAEAARNKGIDPVIIEEYLIVNHRVILNHRMATSLALQGFTIPWDLGKDQERLKELERMFTEKGVPLSSSNGDN
jgi:two-component system OmpR family response regulator